MGRSCQGRLGCAEHVPGITVLNALFAHCRSSEPVVAIQGAIPPPW
jgi:hypothetical protein